jgi:hypothetical protein
VDLQAILDAGWADPAALTRQELAAAEQFWIARRADDQRLEAARAHAGDLVRTWTGRVPRDVGSFGTRLNLDSSDLDLGIGYPVSEREQLMGVLADRAAFKGERFTRFNTTRLVYAFVCDGVEIDLSALTEEDFTVACRMLDQIEAGMTRDERIAHTWVKHQLRTAGRMEEYAAWKLVVYARYCPEFTWVPIPEPASTTRHTPAIALPGERLDLDEAASQPISAASSATRPGSA